MAFSKTDLASLTVGNHRILYAQITGDSAEGAVQVVPGLIIAAHQQNIVKLTQISSGNTAQSFTNYRINAGTTGTFAAGQMGFSGCATIGEFIGVVVTWR